MKKQLIINLGVLLSKRKQRGLPGSQRWLAEQVGSAESTISDYVNNTISRTDLDVVARMLAALNQDLPPDMKDFGPGDFFVEISISGDNDEEELVAVA